MVYAGSSVRRNYNGDRQRERERDRERDRETERERERETEIIKPVRDWIGPMIIKAERQHWTFIKKYGVCHSGWSMTERDT